MPMERSALVYIILTAVTVILGLCVDNRDYVPGQIRGGRVYGEGPVSGSRPGTGLQPPGFMGF